MANYSYGQLESLWEKEGGDPGAEQIAAAVSLAESSGNPDATHTNTDGSIDRGLWQINSIHGKLSTLIPEQNALAAVKISSNGTNWNPWTTYKSGAYKRYLQNVPPDSNTVVSGVAPATDATQAGFLSPFDWLSKALGTGSFKDLAERGGLILLGVIFLFIAILRFTDAGKKMNGKSVAGSVSGGVKESANAHKEGLKVGNETIEEVSDGATTS